MHVLNICVLVYLEQVPDESEEPAAEETKQTEQDKVTEEVQSEEETWEDKEGARFGSLGNF